MMKTKYIKPMTSIHAIITEKFIYNSETNDPASIGSADSQDEKEQSDIRAGGPGVTGSRTNPFTEQNLTNTWEG